MATTIDKTPETDSTAGADTAFPRTGADLLVDAMAQLGADRIFTIVGIGMVGLGQTLFRRRDEVAYVGHLNETNLALAAQGYARQSNKPAVCAVYHASGTALAMMSVTTAWADHSPLILISATSSQAIKGRDQYAETPRSLIEMTTQYTKWSHEVGQAERIPEILARAWEIAMTPPMGPVHLAIPCDLLDEVIGNPVLRDEFARTHNYFETCADEQGLRAAAKLLQSASKPVILCGSEPGQLRASEEMVVVAELLGAPVITEHTASHLGFPTSHDQYVGVIAANKPILEQADAVLSVGFEYTEMGMPGEMPPFPASAKSISLCADPQLVTKQIWPDIALYGHPVPSLARLAELLKESPPADTAKAKGLEACATVRAQRASDMQVARALSRQHGPMDPKQVLLEAQDAVDPDWLVVMAASTIGWLGDVYWEIDKPANFHQVSGKGSAQGWGSPVALGVQMAAPDKRVIAILGDGNLMFSATAIWGAAQHNLPIIFVVANNAGWACIPDAIEGMYGVETTVESSHGLGWTWGDAPIDFTAFARSLSLEAERVETAEQYRACLDKAVASKRPWLIECVVNSNYN